jgi:pyruvate formate lyase activating enzyme
MRKFNDMTDIAIGEAGLPSMAARVHSIETCGTVDGPGLRYVAFFQGCPLRCKYCHNPDTWTTSCGSEMTVDELVKDVLKYKSYICGGGFTASGGEPLLQADSLTELFKRLKSHGIHTALDTSGHMPVNRRAGVPRPTHKTEELLSHTDLVLLDIKSIRPDKFRELTGVELAPTLAFAEYLNQKRIPVWIRYVIVPNLTDSPEDAEKMAEYLAKFSNIERVELLPFHKLGEHKWETMRLPYTLKDTPPPSDEAMAVLRKIFEKREFV